MIRVLVVDDQPLIRGAVAQILGAAADLNVVGEAAEGGTAIRMARSMRPDVVLMDVRMPGVDGIAATSAICAEPDLCSTRVLMLTTFEDEENVAAALRAGASGFLGKGADPDEIADAVRTVHAGEALLSPAATRSLISRYLAGPVTHEPGEQQVLDEPLTPREHEILRLVARGMSNAEIAADLVISPHTAKTHVNRIMAKLGAHDRAQVVVWAYENGVVRAGAR